MIQSYQVSFMSAAIMHVLVTLLTRIYAIWETLIQEQILNTKP